MYGPQNWGALNRNCDGQFQSPIELRERFSRTAVKNSSIIIENFNVKPNSITFSNNGHAASVKLHYQNGPVKIQGGPLDTPYILDNIHWHWGDTDEYGSEHTLNGVRYSAEAHFVTYSSAYGESPQFFGSR